MLDARTRSLVLACPFLFVLHEAEEYRTALPWLAEHSAMIPGAIARVLPQTPDFIGYAAFFFFAVFLIAALIALRSAPRSIPWLGFATLIVARLENAVLHALESVVLFQYTPGVITAVLIVLPVTLYLIRRFVQLELITRSSLLVIIPIAFAVQTLSIGGMLLLG